VAGYDVRIGVAEEWEPLGAAITQAKVEAAGVSTGYVEGSDMNIMFPTVFQKPAWWTQGAALGDWCMLFASHRGPNVLLAHADDPLDPASWAVSSTVALTYETLVDLAADAAVDGVISPARVTDEHISSPSVFVDNVNERFIIMVHAENRNSRANMGVNNSHVSYGLYSTNLLTQSAYTIHGGAGNDKPLEWQEYARFVPQSGHQHGTDACLIITGGGDLKLGLGSTTDWLDQNLVAGWANTIDQNDYDETIEPALRQRHAHAYWLAEDVLKVYFSVTGDSPEHIRSVIVDLVDPATPSTWRAREGSHVHERYPLLDWEGFGMGGIPSVGSAATSPEEQLRDPQVINVGSDRAMFCSVRGEYGVGVYRIAGGAVNV
jgi:hypothetical protein